MTMPTLIVEVGFSAALTGTALHLDDTMRGRLDTGTLAPDTLLVDVSEFVVSVNTRRGATRSDGPYLRYEAGTCTITLRNDDRRFDPTNLTSPYSVAGVTQVEPMRAVRIRADYGGVTYPLWRGFTDEWTVAYDGPDSSYATVTCFDAFGVFSAHDRLAIAAVGAGETTGARIGRILDSINWPAGDRMVSTGEETVQATTLADNVLTEMLLAADTELGEFYMDTQGRTVFRSRSATYTDFRSRYPLACFGDQPVDGDTTINLAANPSLETVTTGWRGGGFANPPTVSRSSTQAHFGSWSLLATWANASSADVPLIEYFASGLTPGKVYTFSVYAYVPSGSPSVACVIATTGPWGANTGGVTDQWVRLTLTTTVNTSSPIFQVWPRNSTTVAGQQVWLDGLQVEEGEAVTDYVDGDQSTSEWDGIAHASTSRRLPELDYGDLGITHDALSITNQVTAARAGGTAQVASDAESISAYLTRSHHRSDLLMETDAEALIWADQVVARRSQPELRVTSLLLKPAKDPSRLWAQAFGRKIGDRVRVVRRPPGGGDPIIRDAWVRGIAHNLADSLDWRTTFVLEQARDIEDASDTFTRTVSSGWGSADTGQAWTVSGAALNEFTVASGAGRHEVFTNFVTVYRSVLDVSWRNLTMLWPSMVWPISPSGAFVRTEVLLRYVDASNLIRVQVIINTGNTVDLQIESVAGGVGTSLAAAATGITHTAGVALKLRVDAVGSIIRARLWKDGTTEPTTWTASGTDSNQRTGAIGVLSLAGPGNTNTKPFNVVYDGLTAQSLHAWS